MAVLYKFMSFIVPLTLRYLKSRRGFTRVITSFSVVGITLGVAALIIVMSVMAGFRDELIDRILGFSGHAQVQIPQFSEEKSKDLTEKLQQIPGVTRVSPYVLGQGLVNYRHQASGVLMRGVTANEIPVQIANNTVAGSQIQRLIEPNTIAMGATLAKKLGIGLGQQLTLLSPQGKRTIAGFIPKVLQVKVVALFDSGFHQFDSGLVLMHLDLAQKFFGLGETISALELRVTEPAKIGSYLPAIQAALGEEKGFVTTWQQQNRPFFNALQVERVTMFIILSLIVLVAAFNIITGQIMLVMDKQADIAILRTMGATKTAILSLFMSNGVLLGGVGIGLGFILGILVTFNLDHLVMWFEKISGSEVFSGEVYFINEIPARLVWPEIAMVMLLALVLVLLASFYPAWRASRLHPVEVLRNA